MKKTITYRLCLVILLSMVLIALISLFSQMKTAQENAKSNSVIQLNQIKQILMNNDQEIRKLEENLREDYFIRAKAAAYIIEKHPEFIGDQVELKKIASLLRVDEFHLFDPEGRLYAGTEPKYFGYTFRSGEQMEFFLPMLKDYNLALCQDVRPNTAEQKLMQYVAVWREDHQGIVQIGMEPIRLLEAMEKNELSHIFTLVTTDKDNTFFAADSSTGIILGSTNQSMIGKLLSDYGINQRPDPSAAEYQGLDIMLDGMKSGCLLQTAGKVVIGVSIPYRSIYQNVTYNMGLMFISLFVLAAAVVLLILRMLDRYIIREMHQLNRDMGKIAAGDLDGRVEVKSLPEFAELSSNINHMVASLLETTGKLSLIFQNVNVPIAVYEYNSDMKRVLATNKIGAILGIDADEMKQILTDHTVFIETLKRVFQHPCKQEDDIYLIGEQNSRYVKIQSYQENGRTLGILVDVTDDMVEKQQIKYERDVDLLTGLLTRRAFFDEMNRLFLQPEELGFAAILMIDADNLKNVNDTWGHEAGDRLLACIAGLLKSCEMAEYLSARLSGDEFVVFLYGAASPSALQEQIDRLYQKMLLSELVLPDGSNMPVRFSCGYTIFQAQSKEYQELLKQADRMLYQAKKKQKGHFVKCEAEEREE